MISMTRRVFRRTLCGVALSLIGTGAANAVDLKIAHFVPPRHAVSQWIEQWAKGLEAASDGELSFKIFPGSQLGPPPKYHGMVKKGQIDIAWLAHGFTPGLFPLTELSNLPYLVASAEAGTKVINNPTLRKQYLDPEHKGLKPLILMTHQPGNINMAREPIRTLADLKGKRVRFASSTIKDFMAALGATPVGLPPTQIADSMQKGTIDGAFIDYGGAGIAFKLGPVTTYTTEMYSYVTSFCVCMNQRRYDKLPDHLKKLIDDSVVGVEQAIGHEWDKLDAIGKDLMVKAGMEPVRLEAEQDQAFRQAGEQVAKDRVKQLTDKGLPAQAVLDMMRELAKDANANSRNFWTGK
ncbi:MAG: TRAP transporter substrate-binding protein [Burkholderiaceae bacterium]